MTKLEIILFITAAISVVTTMALNKENNKLKNKYKKHRCNLEKIICDGKCCYYCEDETICSAACNGNPLVCGNSREE